MPFTCSRVASGKNLAKSSSSRGWFSLEPALRDGVPLVTVSSSDWKAGAAQASQRRTGACSGALRLLTLVLTLHEAHAFKGCLMSEG